MRRCLCGQTSAFHHSHSGQTILYDKLKRYAQILPTGCVLRSQSSARLGRVLCRGSDAGRLAGHQSAFRSSRGGAWVTHRGHAAEWRARALTLPAAPTLHVCWLCTPPEGRADITKQAARFTIGALSSPHVLPSPGPVPCHKQNATYPAPSPHQTEHPNVLVWGDIPGESMHILVCQI